jgi:hypothetical protein
MPALSTVPAGRGLDGAHNRSGSFVAVKKENVNSAMKTLSKIILIGPHNLNLEQ